MNDLLAFAHSLADAAGNVIRPYFGAALDIETKPDDSPVSRADREAEAVLRALIQKTYPDHGIYGEEHGQENINTRYVWVIDPIDGTRAFLAGKKEWGTLIALCENGIPILGILDQPVTGERWVGAKGLATKNAVEIHSARTQFLSDATISSTSARYFTPPQATAFVRLAEQCREVIEDGDCYAYGLLASGERDLVVDARLKPYDILALIPIIEAAGGIISHWDGTAITLTHYANVIAAANAELHQEALAILQKQL